MKEAKNTERKEEGKLPREAKMKTEEEDNGAERRGQNRQLEVMGELTD